METKPNLHDEIGKTKLCHDGVSSCLMLEHSCTLFPTNDRVGRGTIVLSGVDCVLNGGTQHWTLSHEIDFCLI